MKQDKIFADEWQNWSWKILVTSWAKQMELWVKFFTFSKKFFDKFSSNNLFWTKIHCYFWYLLWNEPKSFKKSHRSVLCDKCKPFLLVASKNQWEGRMKCLISQFCLETLWLSQSETVERYFRCFFVNYKY